MKSTKSLIAVVILALVAGFGVLLFTRLQSSNTTIYFLQTANGKLNLVSADLKHPGKTDVVVAGTGAENKPPVSGSSPSDQMLSTTYQTAILTRPDWRYVALRSQREASVAKLYVYDHNANQLKTIDDSKAGFEFGGWLDGRLIYVTTQPPTLSQDTPGPTYIKSYDPASGTTATILKTDDTVYPPCIISGKLLYATRATAGNSSKIRIIATDSTGRDSTTLLSKDVADGTVTNNIYSPDSLYYTIYGDGVSYYVYTDGKIQPTTQALAEHQAYHFYVASPSGKQTAWYESKDGKSQIMVGDASGKNGKLVTTLDSDYRPYAWSDNTLLVAKDDGTVFNADAHSKLYKLNSTDGKGTLTEIAGFSQSAKGYNIAMAGYPGAKYGYAGIFTF